MSAELESVTINILKAANLCRSIILFSLGCGNIIEAMLKIEVKTKICILIAYVVSWCIGPLICHA